MKTTYIEELAVLEANTSEPGDLNEIENEVVRSALQDVYAKLGAMQASVDSQSTMLDRRTKIFSPSKGFSFETYNSRGA